MATAACSPTTGPSAGGDGKQLTVGFAQVGAESAWRTANSKSIQEEAENRARGELVGFALSPSPIRGSVTLEPAAFDAFVTALDAGGVYVDLHTASCPAGALRAQVY